MLIYWEVFRPIIEQTPWRKSLSPHPNPPLMGFHENTEVENETSDGEKTTDGPRAYPR